MPILNVECVAESSDLAPSLAQSIADAVGKALGTPPGRTWVRLRVLEAQMYAENGTACGADELPVFVDLLHHQSPTGDALHAEISALTDSIARVFGRPTSRVHICYAPAAAGRQAFGGRLVV